MSLARQTITPELRRWIVDQARAGQDPDSVIAAMRASGWDEAVAIRAMEETLQQVLQEQGAHAVAARVPEPDLAGSPAAVWALDRDVRVLMQMRSPRVVVFGDLLSADECGELIELARPRLARSETVQQSTGGSEIHAARTSRGMFFGRGEAGLIARIEERIGALVNWPVDHGEGLQVLHYGPGARYDPHYDYFDPAQPGTPTILKRGGQRVATLVMYLNTPARGGGTTFPDAGLEVGAVQGHAVFFSYDRPHPATRSLHGGAPVVEGEKWVATKWLREGVFT
jgi:prolyl 4-hydroxylase